MTDHNIVQAAREALTRAMPLITPGAPVPTRPALISAVIDLTTHLRALADHVEAGQEHPIGDDEDLTSAELHAREAANAVALIRRIDPDLGARLAADLDGTSDRHRDKALYDLFVVGPHHTVREAVDTVAAQIKRVHR